jgi:hypothetical protein
MVECSICLIPEIINSEKVSLQCSHNFCKPCIDGWLNTGKTTCPLCIHEISYFEYNQDKYRIIKVRQSEHNSNIQINQDNISINKKTCNILRGISFIIIGLFFFQTFIIHKMYSKNDKLRELYSIELNKYNTLIDDEQSVIMKTPQINERRICMIPFYYIKRCFNL